MIDNQHDAAGPLGRYMKLVLVKTKDGCIAIAGIGLGEARAPVYEHSTPGNKSGDVGLQDRHNL